MPEQTFDIQELVKASGVPRRTIYFYVQQGLLPAPEGAGLAAYYTRAHLVRLQIIPILRQQGLRLDEIRQRFGQMTQAEMETLVSTQPAGSPTVQDAAAPAKPAAMLPPTVRPQSKPIEIREGRPAAERRFVHYQLPSGITLMAPDDLSQAEQMRLRQLLKAAAQIFSTPIF